MTPSKQELERSARQAAARIPAGRRTAALAAAGTAAATAAGAAGVAGLRRLISSGGGALDSTSYRLLAGEPVSDGIKRVVTARVDNALAELRGETDGDHAEAVHEARKDMKKIRSVVRLVRDALGEEAYRRENDHYRDIGRTLSSFRDAEVMVQTLETLQGRFEPARERFRRLREQLEADLGRGRDDGSLEQAMARAGGALEQGRARTESWPLSGDDWKLIEPGLRRSYRRGRKRLRAVEEEPSVVNLHEWRKRVKDLWYQLRLIRDAEPALIGALAEHAHLLSEHLGDDHDLALLREEAGARGDAFAEAGDQRLLFELIDQRRGELRFAATALGERIYTERPKQFTKALAARWRAWR